MFDRTGDRTRRRFRATRLAVVRAAVAAAWLALPPVAAAFELGELRGGMDYWAAKAALERQTDRFLDFGPDFMNARSDGGADGAVTFRTLFCDNRLRAANMVIEGKPEVLFGLLRTLVDRHGAPAALRSLNGPDGLFFEWRQSGTAGHVVSVAIAVDALSEGRSMMEVSGADPSVCTAGGDAPVAPPADPDPDGAHDAEDGDAAP